MARKQLSINIWSKYVSLYQKVFTHSLEKLTTCDHTSKQEDEISSALWTILQRVCKEWSLRDKVDIPAPLAQLPQQNAEKAIKNGINSLPKPDFSCPKFDPTCGEHLFLDIECKMLGNPTSPSWKLNRNYVKNGISRFDNDHEYGKGVPHGLMVGYIVSMEPLAILDEVNNTLSCKCQKLTFSFNGKVDHCAVKMKRSRVQPVIFQLIHIWADLR